MAKVTSWLNGDLDPTFQQLTDFAKATVTPVGYFFLTEPPADALPIADFRTIADVDRPRASPDLLDTIYLCEQRQEWFREYSLRVDLDPVDFVGSLTEESPAQIAADAIRSLLSIKPGALERLPGPQDALKMLIEAAERMGMLVMVSGIVGGNTHRKLDPREFRGFCLSDSLAPLIFINGADTKNAQIFTLIHEIGHLAIGQSAVSSADPADNTGQTSERWCNQVAAEFLLPRAELPASVSGPVDDLIYRLARRHKVSTLVVISRLYELRLLNWTDYQTVYTRERSRLLALLAAQKKTKGGEWYYTQPYRVSRRFARTLIEDTLEGGTLHRRAFQLLGTRNPETFYKLGETVGVHDVPA